MLDNAVFFFKYLPMIIEKEVILNRDDDLLNYCIPSHEIDKSFIVDYFL